MKKENVDINYINNEYDFTFEFSRIDRNDYLSGEINGEINGEISKNEEKVLDTLRNNNKLTKQGLIESTNLSSRTIDRVLANLKSKGLLERQGSNKTGYWKVK